MSALLHKRVPAWMGTLVILVTSATMALVLQQALRGTEQAQLSIPSPLPHLDDAAKQQEHLAMLALVPYESVTRKTIRNGAWSDPTIWLGALVPSANDNVLISQGTSVTLDTETARVRTVRVDGTLSFSREKSTHLWVDTVVVNPTGFLDIGSIQSPIPAALTARITIIKDNPVVAETAYDPLELRKGIIAHGPFRTHGVKKTAFVPLAGARAGDRTLTLSENPENWVAGDKLILAATNFETVNTEHLEIASIVGRTVTLVTPVQTDHVPPVVDPPLQVHVANVTRNVVIESEDPSIIAQRGHVMVMHNNSADVRYASFLGIGRTDAFRAIQDPETMLDPPPGGKQSGLADGPNPRGRYSLHFHRTGADPSFRPIQVIGNVAIGGAGWCFTNHGGNVDFIDNVAYDCVGSAFVAEAGDEHGSWVHNIAFGKKERSTTFKVEHEAGLLWADHYGFGIQQRLESVRQNVSAGVMLGFSYYNAPYTAAQVTAHLPEDLRVLPNENGETRMVPIGEFKDNIAYASQEAAYFPWATGQHMHPAYEPQITNVAENFTSWGTGGTDVAAQYTWWTKMVNPRIISVAAPGAGQGSAPFRFNLGAHNSVIGGSVTGPIFEVASYDGGLIIDGTDFRNVPGEGIVYVKIGGPGAITHLKNLKFHTHQPNSKTGRTNPYIHFSGAAPAPSMDNLSRVGRAFLDGKELFSFYQAPDYVPFPTADAGIDSRYVGLTNKQLMDQYQVAFRGRVAPADAVVSQAFDALIATTSSFCSPEFSASIVSRTLTNPLPKYPLSESFNDPGATTDYAVTVKNNDDPSCAASTFTVTPVLPAGWTQEPASFEATLTPGKNATRIVRITAPANAAAGEYDLLQVASRGGFSGTAKTTHTVIDTVDPTVAFLAPVRGDTVRGTITVSVDARDNAGITKVMFNGKPFGRGFLPMTRVGSTTRWDSPAMDTTRLTDGPFTFGVIASDGIVSHDVTATLDVVINNSPTGIPPTVSLTAPADNAAVRGTVTLSADAEDNVGVAGVQFMLDGNPVGSESTTAPYAVTLDTSTVDPGAHTIYAIARDTHGNRTTAESRNLIVLPPDTTPPTVPTGLNAESADNASVELIWNESSDDVGVASYHVYRDGAKVGETVKPNFLDASVAACTSYTYAVAALDAVGNISSRSTGVSITTEGCRPAAPPESSSSATSSARSSGKGSQSSQQSTSSSSSTSRSEKSGGASSSSSSQESSARSGKNTTSASSSANTKSVSSRSANGSSASSKN